MYTTHTLPVSPLQEFREGNLVEMSFHPLSLLLSALVFRERILSLLSLSFGRSLQCRGYLFELCSVLKLSAYFQLTTSALRELQAFRFLAFAFETSECGIVSQLL